MPWRWIGTATPMEDLGTWSSTTRTGGRGVGQWKGGGWSIEEREITNIWTI